MRTCVALVWLTVAAVPHMLAKEMVAMPAETGVVALSQEHYAAVNRPRRIYVNNDVGFPVESFELPPEVWLPARFSLFDRSGSQVDSIGWNLDEGNVAAYPSEIIPRLPYPGLQRQWEEGIDLVARLVEETRRRGLECFWEYRVQGWDREADLRTFYLYPFMQQHPEWTLSGEASPPANWNFAEPGVRAYKLAILREVAERYELDGLNLDFARGPQVLPWGRAWELRDQLTDFVRQVRLMLQEVAAQRGRPFLLSVRVADTVPGCHYDGMDIEAWVQQNLVDMIIIGSRSIEVDLPGFRELTRGSHVKLYPCIDQYHSPDGYHRPPVEFFRGLAANWWRQGADGIATFNFTNETEEAGETLGMRALGEVFVYHPQLGQSYLEMGKPEGLALLDKWFVAGRRYGGGWEDRWSNYLNMNHQAPLPLEVPAGIDTALRERVRAEGWQVDEVEGAAPSLWTEVYAADDIAARAEQVERLELWLHLAGAGPQDPLQVKLNGVLLKAPTVQREPHYHAHGAAEAEGHWWVYPLHPGQMAVGRNLVTMRRPGAPDPARLDKVELRVAYRR